MSFNPEPSATLATCSPPQLRIEAPKYINYSNAQQTISQALRREIRFLAMRRHNKA